MKDLKNKYGALATPIYQTSTFVFKNVEEGAKRFLGEEEGYIYSRLSNPTLTVAEEKVAILENGEKALATSSGMGAISATLWTLLKAGDHVLADKTLYGCTYAYISHGLTKFGVEVDFVDMSDLEEVKIKLKDNTKVIYLETPANPNLKIVDIQKISELSHNKNSNIKVVVDNTFATPFCQKPLLLGADIVVHSATKYLNGHGDVIAGFVVGSQEMINDIRTVGLKDMTGAVLGPNEAFLIIRGLKTFEIRMQKHCENAMKVAEFLEQNEKVEKVYYPGLKTHVGYEVAVKQMQAFGGILAFEVKGGLEAGKKLLNNLEMITIAVSLGDAETLIQHPASMTHSPYTKEERELAGITDGLIRLSVGLENVEDIILDLEKAFLKI